jgi:DNA end-binding protein Ku
LPERDRHEAPRARALWSGTITFGLVNIPVELYTAMRGRQTSMKMVDVDGHPLGREYYCAEDDEKLEPDEIVRGYETDSGDMIVVTDEELESVAPEMTRDIELRRFVPLEQIPPTYFQRPYFLAPAGRSAKAYHLLATTMERTKRVGIGTFVMRGHQYLVAILSDGGVLRAETMRFADELRAPKEVGLPKPEKPPAKTVKALSDAIGALVHDRLDTGDMTDIYAGKIHALVEAKEKKGEDVVDTSGADDEETGEEGGGAEVIDLVKLLKQRLSANATVTTADESRHERKRSGRKAAKRAKMSDAPAARKASVDDLDALSKEALYERAQALDIPGRSKMSKGALAKALRKTSS